MHVKPSPFRARKKAFVPPPRELTVEEKGMHKYGCLMLLLPPDLRKEITDWSLGNIPDFHQGPGGLELMPHVTIKYGFKNSDMETVQQLKSLLTRHGPVRLNLRKLSLFKGNEDGDVLKAEVESDQLHELNRVISESFSCHDKYPTYQPHCTIAYLRPEISYAYAELHAPFCHRPVHCEMALWGGADDVKVDIPLTFVVGMGMRRKGLPEPPQPSPSPLGSKRQDGTDIHERPTETPVEYTPPKGQEPTPEPGDDTEEWKKWSVGIPPQEEGGIPGEATGVRPSVGPEEGGVALDAPTEVPAVPIHPPNPAPAHTTRAGPLPVVWDGRPHVATLLHAPMRTLTQIGDSTRNRNKVYLVSAGDTLGVWKPKSGEFPGLRANTPAGTYWMRSLVASLWADLLGFKDIVATTTARHHDGDVGSVQQYLSGNHYHPARLQPNAGARPSRGSTGGKWDGPDLARAALFDFITLNMDRRPSNYFVKFGLIDLDLTFPESHDEEDAEYVDSELLEQGIINGLPLSDEPARWDDKTIQEAVRLAIEVGLSERAAGLGGDRLEAARFYHRSGDNFHRMWRGAGIKSLYDLNKYHSV